MKPVLSRPVLLAGLLAAAACAPALAALGAGDRAPAFEAAAALDGRDFAFSLTDALRRGPVVVYFYPSAYTGGCNIQAHAFAVAHAKFAAAGAQVIGVSLDSIERLRGFSADPAYCAGKVAQASDADGRIAKDYEVAVRDAVPGRTDTRGHAIDHGYAERTTFVITPDGRIAGSIGGVAPADNVARALELVQQLAGAAR